MSPRRALVATAILPTRGAAQHQPPSVAIQEIASGKATVRVVGTSPLDPPPSAVAVMHDPAE